MDSFILAVNNLQILPEFSILEGKEKLIFIPTSWKMASVMYSDFPISLWADLKFHDQDYVIGAYLSFVIFRIWLHRPSKSSNKRKKPKRKSKGGYTTKQRTGTTDYRKGGMTLSTVSNRKK